MCGIIGYLTTAGNGDIPTSVRPHMQTGIQRMRLRGPNAQALCQVGPALLGHVRLAIIDPSGGQQPMQDQETGVTITYNGEVYNFRELKKELTALGHTFHTNCDTEVVLRAWIEWDTACFKRFNGFFAMGIYDPRERKIILARDRMGLKPLYYAPAAEACTFASTIPALIPVLRNADPNFACKVDPAVMSHYLTTRLPILNGRTLVDGIHLLTAGHYLEVGPDRLDYTETPYWKRPVCRPDEKADTSFEDAVQETAELLEDSVRMRLVSDVPVGGFLSGGLDSSIIATCANRHHSVPLPLFCAGSDDESLNEFEYARELAEQLDLRLHLETIDASEFDANWEFLIGQKGLPLSTPNEVSIYKLALALKKQCTVTLTGEGADEIFGGYVQPQFGAFDFDRSPRNPEDVDEDSALTWAMRMHVGRAWFMNDTDHFLSCDSWMNIADKMTLFHPDIWEDVLEGDAETICHYEDFFESLEGCSTFDKRMHLHAQFNLENLLLRVDTSTMAASVEARVPFTDHRLVEMAFQLPDHYKMDWLTEAGRLAGKELTVAQIDAAMSLETKRLPRHAFRSQLPKSIIERKKMSFPVPFTQWLSGPLAEELGEFCLQSPLVQEYFDPAVIAGMFTRKDKSLWLIANLCKWHAVLQEL